MNIPLRGTFLLLVSVFVAGSAIAQGIKMGEVIVMSTSSVKKDVKAESFKSFID